LHVEIEKQKRTRRKTVGIQKRGAKNGGKKATVNDPNDIPIRHESVSLGAVRVGDYNGIVDGLSEGL
jgi:hypothetical protein